MPLHCAIIGYRRDVLGVTECLEPGCLPSHDRMPGVSGVVQVDIESSSFVILLNLCMGVNMRDSYLVLYAPRLVLLV